MILSRYVFVKIASSNFGYWKSISDYKIEKIERGNNKSQRLKVKVEDLKPNSNVKVSCKCDTCGIKYIQRFSRNKQICSNCRNLSRMKNNKYGKANIGKRIPSISGDKHPRWNSQKTEYKMYCNKVRWITEQTYNKFKDVINPFGYPRKVCGVQGGWQLDHRISIKRGFLLGINPKIIGSLDNLQMLTWSDNRNKHYK